MNQLLIIRLYRRGVSKRTTFESCDAGLETRGDERMFIEKEPPYNEGSDMKIKQLASTE